jgi:hypothetical protein
VTALRCGGHLEEAGSQFSGLEVLERLFTECRELASWLEGRGFDVEGILEEGEGLLDNALWLYWLLRDVLAGNCKLADAWRGEREGACRDVEALYFECTYHGGEGRVERYKRVVARIGFCTFVAEMPVHVDARQL